MENNYKVYQHVTPDGMYYFGATNNIKRRWRNNGVEYKGTALYPYIEKYGWDNIKHIVLFKDQTKENALWIEDFLIETAREDGVCINKQRSGLVSKEEGYQKNQSKQYYEQNKQQILDKKQQYYEQNKDRKRQYYEQNKDKRKDYLEQNKDKIREQSRQRYQKNRDKILEQRQQRYQKNRDKSKKYYEQNRDKILEQSRQRYQRKKEEKQFKELGNLPLW